MEHPRSCDAGPRLQLQHAARALQQRRRSWRAGPHPTRRGQPRVEVVAKQRRRMRHRGRRAHTLRIM